MITERLTVDPSSPDPARIARAAEALRAGQLVAFPTETVYGLGARADDADAVARIFAAKGRPAWNPLIVHVCDVPAAQRLVLAWPSEAEALARAFWPGPLTLVLPRDPARVPDGVTGGGGSVAVRAPSHPVARALIAAADVPVAAPSANRFQQLSPVTADHVMKSLAGRIPMVLDGGRCPQGIESTVVDLTGDVPAVLRFGALPMDALLRVAPGITARVGVAEGAGATSPGTARRHYAPAARLVVVSRGAGDEARAALRGEGAVAVGLARIGGPPSRDPLDRMLPEDPAGYGAELYHSLHALDDAGAALTVLEAPPDEPGWEAARDRIRRAEAPPRG